MEFNDFPRASPNTLSAIRAASINDPDFGLQELDSIFRADTNAAATEVAFPRHNMNHQ
jgi:hypothetical protein